MRTKSGPHLVGREAELQLLADLLEPPLSGGFVVGLSGEPGVGKSALLDRAVARASARGFTVLRARGRQSETHLAFAALHQLLQPLLARVDALPARQRDALLACFAMSESTDANPLFSFLAALELLADAAQSAPVLVCVDDLHWIDHPSLEALEFLARRIGDERVAVVVAARPEFSSFAEDSDTRWIEVAPLGDADAATVLALHAPGLVDAQRARVLRQARGNPLALVEFATVLESHAAPPDTGETLPMTARLERAFLARADELPAAARTVLDIAAVDEGDDITVVLAAARLTGHAAIDDAAPLAAARVGLITVVDDHYEFSHPLVAAALRRAMPPDVRRSVHAALGSVLTRHPERAIWHHASSVTGPDEQVAARLDEAAAAARDRGAVSTALAWHERAAALSPDAGSRASRLISAAEAGFDLGRFTQVEHLRAQLSGVALRPRDRSRLTWLEGAFHDGARSEPADIDRLIGLATGAADDGDTDLAMQLLVGAARRVWWRDPGARTRQDIVTAARGIGLPAGDPRLLAVLALADSMAQSATIIEQLAAWPADADGRPELAGLLGIAAFCVGDFARALAYLSAPVDELRTQGRLGLLAEALAIRAWAEINLGVFDASLSADEAVRLAEETGQQVWAATARIVVALIEAVGGGWTARHPLITQAEHTAMLTPNASSSLLAGAQQARGMAALGADNPEPAYDELHRIFVATDPACQRDQQLWTIGYLADAAMVTDRVDEATALLASSRRLAGPAPALGPRIALEYSQAVLADQSSAQDLFEAALAGAARPYPWHRARLQLSYGSWLRRQRRVMDSRAPLRAARGTFDSLGAHPWAHRADRELRATGERGWRSVPNPRSRLSPQENQIAELAAQGLSNRDIGQRLFLSHRTVASHLYRIFPKLGITSRNQLSAALTRTAPAADRD